MSSTTPATCVPTDLSTAEGKPSCSPEDKYLTERTTMAPSQL